MKREIWRYYLVESPSARLTIVANSKKLAEDVGRRMLGPAFDQPYEGELKIEELGPASVARTRVLEHLLLDEEGRSCGSQALKDVEV